MPLKYILWKLNGVLTSIIPPKQQVQAQPQIAQILLPNGQLQQVQMLWGSTAGMMSLGSAGLGTAATMTQLATSQPITTSTWATSTISTPTVAIPAGHSSTTTNTAPDTKQQTQQTPQQVSSDIVMHQQCIALNDLYFL